MLVVEWYGWKPPNQPPETKRTERQWRLTPVLGDAVGFTTEDDAGSWMNTITTRVTAEGQPIYKPFQVQRGNWPTSLDRANKKAADDWGPGRAGDMGPRGPLIPE
jgi:hypothetical protein